MRKNIITASLDCAHIAVNAGNTAMLQENRNMWNYNDFIIALNTYNLAMDTQKGGK